jgi:hypothetical protein
MDFFFYILLIVTLELANSKILPSWLHSRLNKAESQVENLKLTPQLPPHSDTSYLIEFHSDQVENAGYMEPILQRLERELGTRIRRVNIMRKREYMNVLETIGHDECGTFPFYFNRKTGQAVCGPTSYMNLRRWAEGDTKTIFMDPPEHLTQKDDESTKSKRDIGAKDALKEALMKLGNKIHKRTT